MNKPMTLDQAVEIIIKAIILGPKQDDNEKQAREVIQSYLSRYKNVS